MKLTNRERILSFGALILIAVVLFINFVYLPLTKDIDALRIQSDDLNAQILVAEDKEREIKELEKEIAKIQKKVDKKTENLLKVWDQAELLVFIEETLDELSKKMSVNFFETISVDALQSGEIGIDIFTNYDNLQKICEKLEKSKYFNTIASFVIADGDADDLFMKNKELKVIMNIRFYAQNNMFDYPKNYKFMDGKFDRKDLFKLD